MNPIRHTRKDELLTARISCPAAAASATSQVLDLGQTGGIDDAALVLEYPAMPNLAAGKSVALTVEASADGNTYAAVPGLALTATAGTAAGVSAYACEFRIPYNCPRYIRLKAAVDASAGDNTAAQLELSVRV